MDEFDVWLRAAVRGPIGCVRNGGGVHQSAFNTPTVHRHKCRVLGHFLYQSNHFRSFEKNKFNKTGANIFPSDKL